MFEIEFLFNPNIIKQEGVLLGIIIIVSFLFLLLITIVFTYKEIKEKDGKR